LTPSISAGLGANAVFALDAPDAPRVELDWVAQAQVQAGAQPMTELAAYSEAQGQRPDPKQGATEDIWKPARTPRGGVSWSLLESTDETTRKDAQGYIVSRPIFPAKVKQLDGKRIKVAGWMMPLTASATQKRFVLLGYPPGCPFHFHAAPMQFIEVIAATPFKTNERDVQVVSGVLELTGQDESGVFYRMRAARPG
jgi:hypothetical protein